MIVRPFRMSVALLFLLALGACTSGSRGPARTVVLITVEGLRSDASLPALDRLSATARVFSDARAVSPMSRPSATSMLTGAAPDRSGVRDSAWDRLPPELPTVAERLKAAGWSTAAFVGSPSCGAASGLDRGFGIFDAAKAEHVGPGRYVPKVTPAAKVAANAVAWM